MTDAGAHPATGMTADALRGTFPACEDAPPATGTAVELTVAPHDGEVLDLDAAFALGCETVAPLTAAVTEEECC